MPGHQTNTQQSNIDVGGEEKGEGGGVVISLVPFHAPCQKDHDNAKNKARKTN